MGQGMDEKQRAKIGAQVRQARVSRGWSQVDLGNAAGVSKNTVTSIELGRNVRPGGLRAVLDALDIDPLAAHGTSVSDVQEDIELVTTIIGQWLRVSDEKARKRMIRDLMRLVAGNGE